MRVVDPLVYRTTAPRPGSHAVRAPDRLRPGARTEATALFRAKETTVPETTAELIRRAEKAMDGKHPQHGFVSINNGHQAAMPYLLLALVKEQQAANWHLNGIAHSLSRIAETLEQQPEQAAAAPQLKPKTQRRSWFLRRRTA